MTINQHETKTKFVQRFTHKAFGRLLSILMLLFVVQLCCIQNINAQDKKVTVHATNVPLADLLNDLSKQTNYKFFYSNDVINPNQLITLNVDSMPLKDALNQLLIGKNTGFQLKNNQILLVKKNEEPKPESAQQNSRKITGNVTDDNGQVLPGVTVKIKGSSTGTITDANGSYSLDNVTSDNTVLISFIGMQSREVNVDDQNVLNIKLSESASELDEVVVVGYGVQKKVTLTGAVSSIKGDDVIKTKNENIQNMVAGKISGVRVTQKTSEPGAFNNNFDIRAMGTPLFIIDGVPRTNEDFQRLDPNDIDNMSVLKDASAAIYGVRAANGVVLVTTKRGSNNKIELNYSGSFAWQIPSGLPATVNAIDYMTLRNESQIHNVNGGTPLFNDAQFNDYLTGKKTSTNWYPLVFSNYAPQTIHNLSVTGGNDKTTYYVGLGYQYQEGFFKTKDLNYSKYNIRSNITTKITDRLTFDLNLNLVMDEQDRPYQDSWWIIRGFWRQGPQIPAYANNDPTKLYQGLIEGDNPLSFMDANVSGSRKYNNKWIQPAASLKYEIPGVKGLYLKGMFSYDYYASNNTVYQKEYNQYRYDEASATYSTFIRQSPNRISRDATFRSQLMGQASLNYNGTFGKNQVGGLVVWEAQEKKSDNFSAQRDLVLQLPYLFAGVSTGQLATMNSAADALYNNSNLGLAGKFNYAYDNKYLAEVMFRYDGSSKFAPGSQWGFFPAASLGWRLSEEKFFKNSESLLFINQLKLRASYGKTGDDNASSYQFISGYNYPAGTDSRNFTGGYDFNGSFNASANNKGIPNQYITWYTAKSFDVGLDVEAWNGLLGFTGDYFSRTREGLLAKRNGGIPTVVGAGLPDENLNSDRTYGFDLEISHKNKIGDFRYSVKGLFSLTRIERLYVESRTFGSSWDNWKNNQNNRLQGVHSGLTGDGQYQSWQEILSSPTYTGRGTVIGDYKYQDWNGDGQIDGNDVHPIQFDQYPWMNFSMNLNASYKGFDFDCLFQGSGMSSLIYGEQLRQPMWGSNDSGAMQQFMDRWHPVDPKADPYDPATVWTSGHFAYTGTLPDENSTFNSVNGAYLRLKSIELGYSLPSKVVNVLGVKSVRVYANAYNLLTITQVKYVDPEHPNDTYGYLYPLNKTVTVGLNVKF